MIIGMFGQNPELLEIPDISNWNTKNLQYMSLLFYMNKKLVKLPDKSKWNTGNVKALVCVFGDCESLEYLPDKGKRILKKWKQCKHYFLTAKN